MLLRPIERGLKDIKPTSLLCGSGNFRLPIRKLPIE
jgi:hypothetical protein